MALADEFWDGQLLRHIAVKSRTDATTNREWRFNARKSGSTETNISTMPSDSWQGVLFQNSNISHRAVRAEATEGWHHVLFVVDPSGDPTTMVVDGAAFTSGNGPNGARATGGAGSLFLCGWDQDPNTSWRGRITLVAFYDFAIDDTQHAAHLAAATHLDDYTDAVMADNPVAFWRMQDTSGNLADYTGNGHTAVLESGSPRYKRMGGPMPYARYIELDGSSTWWKVPDDAAWSSTAFTIEAWVWGAPPITRRRPISVGMMRIS